MRTVKQVANEFQCDVETVRDWIASGHIKAVTLPQMGKRRGHYRIPESEVIRLGGEPRKVEAGK